VHFDAFDYVFLLIDWQILFLAKFGKENSAYILEGL